MEDKKKKALFHTIVYGLVAWVVYGLVYCLVRENVSFFQALITAPGIAILLGVLAGTYIAERKKSEKDEK
ncbi:MAG: hypothetical protein J5916_02890 [Oscillospiraceae bacterium]|nr:hypothetical protein [Oscillospiraceae bacterium]MBO5638832.1 hypothetical protein [Oscillospiraceae bacterium]